MNTNKKIVWLVMACIVIFTSVKAYGEGLWKIHSTFNSNRVRVVDADSKVYFVVDKYLYAYDKAAQKTENLTRDNLLSDDWVKNIYFNQARKFLLIAYNSGNIDIISDSGLKINIPDYKNLPVTGTKAINDVTFAQGAIFVATTSGYYVIDDSNFRIIEANYWGSKVQSVARLSSKILLSDGSKLYFAESNSKPTSVEAMTATALTGSATMLPINGDTCFVYTTALYRTYFDAAGTFKYENVSNSKVADYQPCYNGFIAVTGTSVTTTNSCVFYNKSGVKQSSFAFPASLTGSLLSSCEVDGSLWCLNNGGIQKISFGDSGVVTELSTKSIPNSLTSSISYNIVYNDKLKKTYVMNTGTNYFFASAAQLGTISTYDGKNWTDMTPDSATTIGRIKNNKLNDPYSPVFDPEDPETYIVGSWFDGAYKIKGKKVIAKYDWTNSPLTWALNKYYCNTGALQFDKNKNLWLFETHTAADGEVPHIFVLPREKQNLETLTAADWLTPSIPGLTTSKRMHFIITSGDIKIYTAGDYKAPLFVFDDKENPASTSIDYRKYPTLFDESGKLFEWQYIMALREDLNGIVWVGASSGLVCFDPTTAFQDDFHVSHKKMKDNPGKYVLDNVWVTCIAIDEYNRKWVGTIDDGLYLLNADGDEILGHYTSSNTVMTDDRILSLCWNALNKSMMIGLNGTLYEFYPENSLFSTDFSDVVVSPAYVGPDFTGLIRISGLPAGSIIRLMDGEGNIVRTISSAAADTAWDGLDESGKKVDTGVYSIEASSIDGSVVKSGVAKIYFIK